MNFDSSLLLSEIGINEVFKNREWQFNCLCLFKYLYLFSMPYFLQFFLLYAYSSAFLKHHCLKSAQKFFHRSIIICVAQIAFSVQRFHQKGNRQQYSENVELMKCSIRQRTGKCFSWGILFKKYFIKVDGLLCEVNH